ncbi:MAG: tRNA (adenosine(37)-N6)-dimethylallyltransferase MiaA, partial [Rubrivivax sp.]
ISLEPSERAWLHERIARRLWLMFGAGFVAEVRALRARGDLHPGLPSMRCVGYRQVWQGLDEGAFDAAGASRGGAAAAAVEAASVAATRQLAKRQLTWLRSISARQVFACDEAAGLSHAGDAVRAQAERLSR